MAFTVFYTVQINKVATEIFEAAGGKTVVTERFFDEEGYIEELKALQPDAIMCRTEPITAAMMDAAGPNLKVIGKQGAGLDNIDMEAATARKIRVVYAPGLNAQSVAEMSVFLMLACARRHNYVDRQFRSGNYKVRFGLQNTFELKGKTLGLVGCGRIGRMFAEIAKNGFGMEIIGYDPFLKQEQVGDLLTLVENQDDVFKQADFVSLHTPLTPETEHSIGMRQFKMMKPTASIINCSRGEVVNEAELIQAMQEGIINCAGLDVTEQEPLPLDSPLYNLDNVILTPHTAASTQQSVIRCCKAVANDMIAVIEGREAVGAANKF
ncbi:MAG: hydroxyacid dehydrogenase [Lachnospiraceae bacterium]|nr:hydroxyacid dehydrogenase [Lachnospiraceae bacterium]MBQ6856868.1 hydroxyacid dehydrogenase [Lachnospiraceae bacterium]